MKKKKIHPLRKNNSENFPNQWKISFFFPLKNFATPTPQKWFFFFLEIVQINEEKDRGWGKSEKHIFHILLVPIVMKRLNDFLSQNIDILLHTKYALIYLFNYLLIHYDTEAPEDKIPTGHWKMKHKVSAAMLRFICVASWVYIILIPFCVEILCSWNLALLGARVL